MLAALTSLLGCAITVNQSGGSKEPAAKTSEAKKPKTVRAKPAKKPAKDEAKDDSRTASKPDTKKPTKDTDTGKKPSKDDDTGKKPAADAGETPKPKPKPDTDKPKDETPKPSTDTASGPLKPDLSGSLGGGKVQTGDDKQPVSKELSHLVIPVRVPFAEAVSRVDKLIPKTEEETEWTRVSKAGDSPEIEIKYKVWRDHIKASFDDEILKVTVPLHYAAHFRVKIQNPILKSDWIWLTRDDTWGTKEEPQDLTVTVALKPRVESNWEIKSNMRLDPIVHGPIPSGDVCVKVGIKACVSRSTIAPKIRARIDSYLTPKLEAALKKVDGELDDVLHLKDHAEKVWKSLQSPQSVQEIAQDKCPTSMGAACKQPAWIVAAPTAIGVSAPTLDEKDLRVDLSVTGKLAIIAGERPTVQARALPKLDTKPGPAEVDINLELGIPTETLTTMLSKALKGKGVAVPGKPDLLLKGASVVAERDPKSPHRITITAQGTGALKGELKLSGELRYDDKTQELSIAGLDFDSATEKLIKKELVGMDAEALRKQILEHAVWKLSGQTKVLQKAVTSALSRTLKGELGVTGDLDQLSVHDFEMDDDGLSLHVSLKGKLAVKYTPKK